MLRFWKVAIHILAMGVLSGAAVLAPTPAHAQQYRVVSKSCESCGRAVSVSSQVGDTCPYCGVTWGVENQQVIPTHQPREVAVSAAPDFKWCIDCGHRVSAASRPGQRCPYCGVHWSFYDRGYRPGRSRRGRARAARFTGSYDSSGPSLDWVHQQNVTNVQNIQNQLNQQRLFDQQQRQMTPPPLPAR